MDGRHTFGKDSVLAPVLAPKGFDGFGAGRYAYVAAWPECFRASEEGVRALNRLGYLGPGAWADEWGGLMAAGCLDADL
jgi:hypothetical protein